MNKKYFLEFILTVKEAPIEVIRNSLVEFGENLSIEIQLEDSVCVAPKQNFSVDMQDVSAKNQDLRIKISTEDPTIIFDTCSQFGRLKSVKID